MPDRIVPLKRETHLPTVLRIAKKEAPSVAALALGHKTSITSLSGDDQAGRSTITFMLDAPFVSM